MSFKHFDVFVIGTGRAGRDVAIAMAKAGKVVAIADHQAYGGTCANRGCDPKKVIAGLTEIIYRADLLKGNGIKTMPQFDWQDLQKFKLNFTDAVPFVNERNLKNLGIELYHQSPKFLNRNTLSVEGKTVTSDKIVIATGLTPRTFNFAGANYALTSDDFLEMEDLPKSMILIGGGFIGMEFAHIATRLGVDVTLIHSHERPLNQFDEQIVNLLVKASEDIGIKFIFNARATKIEKLEDGNFKVYANQAGSEVSVSAERVFNVAGRVPAVEDLNLDKGGVSYDARGVEVNEQLQNPGNPDVYACGDVAGSPGPHLTPIAPREAAVVISQLLGEDPKNVNYPVVPSAVYTFPNVAKVGMSEADAEAAGIPYTVIFKEASKWFSAKHINSPYYGFKTIINKETKEILGVHLISSDASEVINLFSLAIQQKMTVQEFREVVFTYPSSSIETLWMF